MAARLCDEIPVAQTNGDELESFMLVMLWAVAGYARNGLSATDRGDYLRQFDAPGRILKENLTKSLQDLQLSSSHLDKMLDDLMEGWKWRYTKLTHKMSKKEQQDAKDAADRLESHEWMMNTLQAALEDAAWKASLDQAVHQKVASRNTERWGKRKSQCSEYDMLNNDVRNFYAYKVGDDEDDDEDDEEDNDSDDDD